MTENGGYKQAYVRLRSHTTGAWFVHPDLRPRLVADAEEQGSNLTEVALRILCDRYRVPYAVNGRRTSPKPADEILNVRLPMALYRAIKSSNDVPYQDAIRADLCAHYGLEMPSAAAAA